MCGLDLVRIQFEFGEKRKRWKCKFRWQEIFDKHDYVTRSKESNAWLIHYTVRFRIAVLRMSGEWLLTLKRDHRENLGLNKWSNIHIQPGVHHLQISVSVVFSREFYLELQLTARKQLAKLITAEVERGHVMLR